MAPVAQGKNFKEIMIRNICERRELLQPLQLHHVLLNAKKLFINIRTIINQDKAIWWKKSVAPP